MQIIFRQLLHCQFSGLTIMPAHDSALSIYLIRTKKNDEHSEKRSSNEAYRLNQF